MYHAIQAAGRVQYLSVRYGEVEAALKALDPRGLLIFTHAPDIEFAKALLRNAKRWSANRP